MFHPQVFYYDVMVGSGFKYRPERTAVTTRVYTGRIYIPIQGLTGNVTSDTCFHVYGLVGHRFTPQKHSVYWYTTSVFTYKIHTITQIWADWHTHFSEVSESLVSTCLLANLMEGALSYAFPLLPFDPVRNKNIQLNEFNTILLCQAPAVPD